MRTCCWRPLARGLPRSGTPNLPRQISSSGAVRPVRRRPPWAGGTALGSGISFARLARREEGRMTTAVDDRGATRDPRRSPRARGGRASTGCSRRRRRRRAARAARLPALPDRLRPPGLATSTRPSSSTASCWPTACATRRGRCGWSSAGTTRTLVVVDAQRAPAQLAVLARRLGGRDDPPRLRAAARAGRPAARWRPSRAAGRAPAWCCRSCAGPNQPTSRRPSGPPRPAPRCGRSPGPACRRRSPARPPAVAERAHQVSPRPLSANGSSRRLAGREAGAAVLDARGSPSPAPSVAAITRTGPGAWRTALAISSPKASSLP